MSKGVYFHTLGCKVNQYETQAMREQFEKHGYREVDLANADFAVINTCTVTSRSDAKSLSFIRRIKKNSKCDCKIIVTGCLTELNKDRIEKIKDVDFILENKFKSSIADIIDKRIDIDNFESRDTFLSHISYFKNHTRAFLKIQDGCDNNCSYCKVSKVRGVSKSRDIENILEEAKSLIDNSYKEIVLTGVCLGSYGFDFKSDIDIVDVLKALSDISGNFRIRLSSIEPHYISKYLLDYIIENDKICSHLHIPLQSGDNRILKLMNRPHNVEKTLSLIDYTKSRNPGFAFSTDLIIGFPTETDISIHNTIKMLKRIQPVRTHAFKFSLRKETPTFNIKDNIKDSKKKQWHKKIIEVSDDMSKKFRSNFLGRTLRILNEKSKDSKVTGYSENYIYIEGLKSEIELNQFVDMEVIEVTKNKTLGIISDKL